MFFQLYLKRSSSRRHICNTSYSLDWTSSHQCRRRTWSLWQRWECTEKKLNRHFSRKCWKWQFMFLTEYKLSFSFFCQQYSTLYTLLCSNIIPWADWGTGVQTCTDLFIVNTFRLSWPHCRRSAQSHRSPWESRILCPAPPCKCMFIDNLLTRLYLI